ncbi:hypothetical protein PR202_gb08625 [Eleusine coracana subsp. coracana]|uniref:Uncharacterized protein n=1 Tax=Eleusine coracana subsp. coracana TaxID=191504 RepID=A0AAV5EF31_ELECO|nr:hypothetical protein PR202_gb08625 [Eleusine coracana subsp. coracana]
MARPRGTSILVLLLVALAGAADLASAASLSTSSPLATAGGGACARELSGMIQCMMGCFTQVFGCAFGCMGKGPDLPLCIISCDSKSVVCMIRCGLTPSPPGPKPPTPPPPGPKPKPPPPAPKPPAPKPPAPKPPPPGPPYTPPYAVAGSRKAGTTYA